MNASNQTSSQDWRTATSRVPRICRPSMSLVFGMSAVSILFVAVFLGMMVLTASSPGTAFAQGEGSSDPLTLYDANRNGVIDEEEAVTAVSDYLAGRISRETVLAVLSLYESAQSRPTRSSTTPATTTIPSIATPCGHYDANGDGMIDESEVLSATSDYFADELNGSDVLQVVRCHFSPTEFHEESYSFSVAESAGRNSSVGTVAASSTASYSIISGNGAGRFSIASATGALSVATGLDFEVSGRYELTVKAHGNTESTMYDLATVNVTVSDLDESPEYDLDTYRFAIPLSTQSTSTEQVAVGAIRAEDPDDDVVSYRISSGNTSSAACPESNLFTVDALGVVYVCPSGLPTTARNYSRLIVTASDGGSNTDTTRVSVKYTDLPVVDLKLRYDRFTSGHSLDTLIEYNGTATVALTLSVITRNASGASGSASRNRRSVTSPPPFSVGGVQLKPRDVPGGRAYDFSLPASAGETALSIESAQLPEEASVGESLVSLSTRDTSSLATVVSNDQIPVKVYPDSIEVGDSIDGEWGTIPTDQQMPEPNERRLTLTIPSSPDGANIRIDLTSGGRDSVLILEDSSGRVVEWNDDGGTDLNARIVRGLDDGTYTIVGFTKRGGGAGYFTLSVTESTDPPTDPDGEYTDTDDISISTPTLRPSLSRATVTGASWKNSTCSSEISSSVSQGDAVCVEVTGSGFSSGDTQVAVLYTESDHQLGRTPIATVPLGYVSPTAMRGKWTAQWLSRYSDSSSGPNTYGLSILGDDMFVSTTTVSVRRPSTQQQSIVTDPSSTSTAVSSFEGLLRRLGFATTEIAEIRATLWLIYGEGQGYDTEAEFLWEFAQGATYGEWGVRDDPARFGLGYYAGWMIVGFIPVVDIPADIRDFLALDVTKCSVWDLGCIGGGMVWDTIDLASIIPGVGKIGDVPQAARAAAKFKSTPAGKKGAEVLTDTPGIVKNITDDRYLCWAKTWSPRGFCIQDGLFQKLLSIASEWIDLDSLGKGRMPGVDFYKKELTGHTVVAAKSLELRADTYVNTPTRIYSTITGYARTLARHSSDKLEDDLLKRGIEIPEGVTIKRELKVVIPDNVDVTGPLGRQLKRAVCRIMTASEFTTVAVEIWYGESRNGSGYAKWSGMIEDGQELTESACESYLRTSG